MYQDYIGKGAIALALQSAVYPAFIPGRSSTTRARPARVYAFTLVELLVSIAIIALLIGILLPSLKSARNNARRVACTANLKGVAAASLVYAGSDRHEQMIPVHGLYGSVGHDFGAYDYGGKSGIGEPQSGNDPGSSAWGTQNGRGPGTRPLNRIVVKSAVTDYQNDPGPNQINWLNDAQLDLDLFRCPSDRGYVGLHFEAWENSALTSYDHYGTSYAASLLWDARWYGTPECSMWSLSLFLKPSTQVLNPANTLYYVENAARFGWLYNLVGDSGGQESFSSLCADAVNVPFSLVERGFVRGWHGHPFFLTSGFADGHAGWIEMKGHRRPAPRLPYDLGMPGGGVVPYEGYRCGVIRGRGWQLDTLPAPLTPSPVPCDHAHTVSMLNWY